LFSRNSFLHEKDNVRGRDEVIIDLDIIPRLNPMVKKPTQKQISSKWCRRGDGSAIRDKDGFERGFKTSE
jgi:hypothetical protein